MPNSKTRWVWAVMLFLFTAVSVCTIYADDDRRKQKRERKREHRSYEWNDHEDENHERSEHENRYLSPVTNPQYRESCGSCHFAYQPGLLPSGSWRKIVTGLENHFGEVVTLDNESEQAIVQYLVSNAAESSSAKRSVKIMDSLGSNTPIRITEVPYIRGKHHEISSKVIERKTVGSLSNCAACHRSAEKGIYDDDDVVIPR